MEELFSFPDLKGDYYQQVLSRLHEALMPRRYLEIGTDTGNTLALAKCASIAIDPSFQLNNNIVAGKPSCMLFQQKSDDFFRDYDPTILFGGEVDLVFLDGMHWFEFLLRDFMNIEAHCRRNSVVVLHDCIPTDSHIGRRLYSDMSLLEQSIHKDWWAGDVWKSVALLKRYRPDLQIFAFDATPTGLIIITNLDPNSRLLKESYFEIIDTGLAMSHDKETLLTYFNNLKLQSTSNLKSAGQISSHFYL